MCHELLDDLGTMIVSMRETGLHELWFDKEDGGYNAEWCRLQETSDWYRKIELFMSELSRRIKMPVPKAIRVTIPVDGIKAVYGANALLKPGGMLRVADYGYLTYEELVVLQLDIVTGRSIGRGDMLRLGYSFVGAELSVAGTLHTSVGNEPDTQLTTVVNFPFLVEVAHELGLQTNVEMMLGWASRIFGQPQTTLAHCSQGLAYHLEGDARGIDKKFIAKALVSTHRVFNDPVVARRIKEIVARQGETVGTLRLIQEEFKGIVPSQLVARKSEEGKAGFIEEALRLTIMHELAKSEGVVDRIVEKRKIVPMDPCFIPETCQSPTAKAVGLSLEKPATRGLLFANRCPSPAGDRTIG
jgi:hypothetical protein